MRIVDTTLVQVISLSEIAPQCLDKYLLLQATFKFNSWIGTLSEHSLHKHVNISITITLYNLNPCESLSKTQISSVQTHAYQ